MILEIKCFKMFMSKTVGSFITVCQSILVTRKHIS